MCESPPQPPPTCSTYLWLVPVLLGQLLPIPARPYTHIHTCTHASDTHARTSSHLHAHIRHTLVPHHPIYVHTHIRHTHTHAHPATVHIHSQSGRSLLAPHSRGKYDRGHFGRRGGVGLKGHPALSSLLGPPASTRAHTAGRTHRGNRHGGASARTDGEKTNVRVPPTR